MSLVGCSPPEQEKPEKPRGSFDVSIRESSDKVIADIIVRYGGSHMTIRLDDKRAVEDYIKELEFLLSRLREAGEKMRSHEMKLIGDRQKEIQEMLGDEYVPPILPEVRKDN